MTGDTEPREGGAWIGQHPDPNTQEVRDNLGDGAERVAVTNNESDSSTAEGSEPAGHREGGSAGGDDLRRAGQDD